MKVKERGYPVKFHCISCNKEHELLVNREDWDLFNSPSRPFVQDIFPYLSPAERELLISGLCSECWNSLFDDDGDFDNDYDDDGEDCYCE